MNDHHHLWNFSFDTSAPSEDQTIAENCESSQNLRLEEADCNGLRRDEEGRGDHTGP